MLWVRLPLELLELCAPQGELTNQKWSSSSPNLCEVHALYPRGAARSARLPVTEKVTGSNPVEGADLTGLLDLGVRLVSKTRGDAYGVRFLTTLLCASFGFRLRPPVSRTGQMGSTPIRGTDNVGRIANSSYLPGWRNSRRARFRAWCPHLDVEVRLSPWALLRVG